jgi:hypothetical protein
METLRLGEHSAKRIFFDQSRFFESAFSLAKAFGHRSIRSLLGDALRKTDEIPESILNVGKLRSIEQLIPIQTGECNEQPGKCFGHASRNIGLSQRRQEN